MAEAKTGDADERERRLSSALAQMVGDRTKIEKEAAESRIALADQERTQALLELARSNALEVEALQRISEAVAKREAAAKALDSAADGAPLEMDTTVASAALSDAEAAKVDAAAIDAAKTRIATATQAQERRTAASAALVKATNGAPLDVDLAAAAAAMAESEAASVDSASLSVAAKRIATATAAQERRDAAEATLAALLTHEPLAVDVPAAKAAAAAAEEAGVDAATVARHKQTIDAAQEKQAARDAAQAAVAAELSKPALQVNTDEAERHLRTAKAAGVERATLDEHL
jgi:hypothetical protein